MKILRVGMMFLSGILLAGISGCGVLSREPYVPTRYYDFGEPEIFPKTGESLDVLPFSCDGPYRNRMVYRVNSCELSVDEYNRWVQPPNILLTRYLIQAFSASVDEESDSAKLLLDGSIVNFDIDLHGKCIRFGVAYQITESETNVEIVNRCSVFMEPFTKAAPEEFAAAAAKAAHRLADEIQGALEKAKKAKMKKNGLPETPVVPPAPTNPAGNS